MEKELTLLHSIPGRIRLQIPSYADVENFSVIEELLSSISGIEKVTIESITRSMIIYYDVNLLKVKDVLHYVSLLFLFVQENEAQKADEDRSEKKKAISSILLAWYNLVVTIEKSIKSQEKVVNGFKIGYKILKASLGKRKNE